MMYYDSQYFQNVTTDQKCTKLCKVNISTLNYMTNESHNALCCFLNLQFLRTHALKTADDKEL